jgi:hypothetical protein
MDLLPEELLADILRRLPPRPLAVCRSVSKDLRAVIDGRGLLLALAHRVTSGLRGMFINYVGQDRPYFFSRPAGSAIGAEVSFLTRIRWGEVVHHCNGLLLVQDWNGLYVCNPATLRWEQLPPPPWGGISPMHLAFDPPVSLHYEVFFFAEQVPSEPKIPIQPGIKRKPEFRCYSEYTHQKIKDLPSSVRDKYNYDREMHMKGSIEWPPSSYVAQVFSSRTSQWEERTYVQKDDVIVTVSDVWLDPWAPYSVGNETMSYRPPWCNGVYWRGSFYLHCRGGFIMR